MVRADFRLREGHQLSGMYFQSRGTENNPTRTGNQILSYAGVQNYGGQYNGVLNEVWSISSSKVNSARVYYSLNHFVGVNIYGNQHLLPDLGSQAVTGSDLHSAALLQHTRLLADGNQWGRTERHGIVDARSFRYAELDISRP